MNELEVEVEVELELELEGEEMEAAMERAWDLHDKISDAIHSLSKSHFLNSLGNRNHNLQPYSHALSIPTLSNEDDIFAEITSLNAIRNALETLENQLHFLHTLQLQQRAERDSALMHLEESRLMLLKRLKEHRGRDLSVIKEALAFAIEGDETEDAHFNSNVMPKATKALSIDRNDKRGNNAADIQKKWQGGLTYFLDYGVQFVKNSDNLHAMAGVVAKFALVAVSMLAIFRLQQTTQRATKEDSRNKTLKVQKNTKQYTEHQCKTNVEDYFRKNPVAESTHLPGHYCFTSLDVLFGRG